ncbi:IgGFc-binding protein-like [Leptodactylus fuscus]
MGWVPGLQFWAFLAFLCDPYGLFLQLSLVRSCDGLFPVMFSALLTGICSAGPLGKEFVTVFMQNYQLSYSNESRLFITGYNPSTTVSIWMNKSSFRQALMLSETSTLIVRIPPYAELPESDKSYNVFVIEADKPISVLSLNYKSFSADTSIVYPIEDLGTDYYVVTPLDGPDDAFKEFSVVSSKEPTNVDIFLTGEVSYQKRTYAAGSKLTVLLEPYSALQLLSRENLTGTRVVSQKPVAVLSGHTCTWKNTKCNHVYEQLLPVPSWGTSFIIPPIPLQRKSDIVFVVAAKNTEIDYQFDTQKSSQNLNAGQAIQLEVPVRTPLYLNASTGIQVIYYCTGWQDSKSFTQYDPILMTIPPVSSYCSSYYIIGQQGFENYGTIVAKKTDFSRVTQNKNPVANLTWNDIPGTDYSWAMQRFGIEFGFQLVENPASPFMLLSYGFVKQNSYGSPAICVNVSSGPSCNTVKCRAKEKCQLSNGKPICIPDSLAYCHAVGDPHYRTFDGSFYDFQGTCTYTVAKTCGKDSSLPVFNIEAKNENRGSTRVSYVSHVTVQISEYSISLVRNEYGFVRVNNQRQRLPMNLNDGQVRLYQSGGSVLIETDFALKVYYDWNSILKVSISSSFFNSVCGLCGNYNGNPSDDLMTPAGTQAPNLPDFGRSWQVEDRDKFCWHNCNGECKACPLDSQQTYSSEESCGLISKLLHGPFSQCHTVIDPKPYLDNCVYDVCMNGGSKQILCQSIKTYSDACQRSNVSISEWRLLSGCPMQCPVNSEYKLCAQACPATCNDDATPSICSESCVESCQCRAGYVLDEGKCIPKSACGCVYQGKLYSPNEVFWGDNKCEKQCVCNPSTKKVECKMARCKSSEQCSVVNGIQNCYAVSNGTCSASGDPHYITFDGLRYDFQGTCIYQYAGLCKKSDDLVDFQVNVQNENRGSKVVSYVSAVQVKLWSFDIVVDRKYKDKVLLNGVLTNLPLFETGKLTIYKQGYLAVIQTSFGLRVAYNWDSQIAVTLPSSYAGAVCGLCGNFDNDKSNDFLMRNDQLATKPSLFGNSWKVQDVSGCHEDDDKGVCSKLAELELRHLTDKEGCGIIKDGNGPFRECHAKMNPEGHFKSCVYDACFYEGRQDVLCKIIASYATLCQEAGVAIYPWRSSKFCSPICPKNSHYEVCSSGCAPTCLSLSPPLGCKPGCSEGCDCNDGFILSGGGCVPISQCGCKYNARYYKSGEVFYPSGLCDLKCVCTASGVVECKAFSCGPNEECRVTDGIQKCQPVGSANCSAAGDPHYMSFDGVAFDFQGTCTYTLSKTITKKDNLVPFAINVTNEKWGNGKVSVTKRVSFDVYGYSLVLQYEVGGKILVNGVYFNLPIYLEDGRIRIYQHGIRVLIDTDFGVRVNYDLVYHVIVTVPGNYKEQLGGLCGNYNSDRRDDFKLPDRTVTTDVTRFGASWKVQIPGVACDDGCGGSGNVCPTCDQKKQEIFQTAGYCGFLKKPGGPLSSCYATIDPDPYFNNCIYDLCAGAGDGSILCQSIHGYVAACQAAGVTVQPWRTDAFCPLKCPANSQYKVCADVCSVICAGVTDPAKCPETCSEGCECNDGFFFDGTGCVSMSQCGCFEDGRYYPLNERVLSSDCKQACTCSPMGGLICEDTGCAADETCQIKDGVVACINKDPCKSVKCRIKETCKIKDRNPVCVPDFTRNCWGWGDPHYHTFDGYDYDFQGTCTYILSKYGGGDDGLVPFTIEEKNDNRGTQAVSYVRTVTIYVYGYKIAIMKDEFGKVRVNDVITNLPVTLLNGKIWARISGANAVVQTDFGLQVTYEYKWHVVITLSSSYYGLTQGLCGNFNQNINDERITADNTLLPSILEWVKSWKVKDGDPFCFDYCPGLKCPTCDDAKKNLYGDDKRCGLISKVGNGPFQECHPKINPDNFFASCLYDVCINGGAKQFLCQALNAYANTCRKQGAQIYDWRTPSGCVLPCPMNSHYEFCGNACPATCTDRTAPSQCTEACVETCQCNDGFVLSGDKCVPVSGCGCTYNGAYYQANHEFWEDDNCRRICKCDPNVGLVVCKDGGCKDGERCLVSKGVRSCQPVSFVTCIGSGDPHYTTFDGKRYDFMGTCIYQLVGVTSTNPSVPHFKVTVQNNNRGGNKAVSYTKVVTLEAYDLVLTLSMDYTRRILVNGVVTSLPFYYQMNKVVAYMSGSQGIIKTDFDVTVTYDWYSYVAVTISSNYVNSVGGLCGNYNKNPNDDFNMKDGNTATNAVQFGNSWKVGDVPGCSPGCPGSCPVCSEVQKEQYKTETYCGLMNKPSGPFSKCYSVVDPTSFINDCVFDACQYKGHPSSFCNAIGLYVASCQAAGVRLQEWRSPSFCSLSCPLNSHYELCGNSCPITCYGLSSPAGCDSPCKEACYCDDGYILSGHKCVAIVNCGCVYQEQYYHKNETFYPNGQCREKCQCGADGIVRCKSIACGPEEECKLVNGVWGCRAKESGRCEASGDPHYISFDGLRFDFQGTCTYILSKVLEDDADLVMFSIAVEHEGYGNGKVAVTRLVVVSVYGYTIAIERNMRSKVKVDGELTNLPLVLDDDRILINQEGGNVVLQTDFGLKILYDTIYHVILTVPSTYRGKLGGLCGNFNGDKIDDFRLPSKEVVKNVNEFGVSWKVTVAGAKCSDGCNEGECPVCTEAKLQPFKAASSCGLMTNPSGPFQACHSKISPYEYFNFCVYDSCATDGKDDVLCKSLQAYAAVCHAVGVTIATWRSPTFCPMSCPANSHYELCTRSCEQSCSGLMAPMKCTDQCFEGCECNTGYVLDGDHCVTADKCGCAFNGKYMREGESSFTTDCTIQCKCQAGGVTCTAFTCGDKENCRLVNGVRGCYKMEGECTVNSLKLITFDGLTGGPIGTGPVEVASLCDGKATSWFRVIADLQSCGKAAASVARLHVFLDGSLVTFSKDKEIWVNGRLDRLPVASGILSANAGEESVLIQITADLNIELTTSGNLVVRVSDKLSGLICGACGNFNGNTFDDLKSPGGDLVTDIVELIASWRARDLTSCMKSHNTGNATAVPVSKVLMLFSVSAKEEVGAAMGWSGPSNSLGAPLSPIESRHYG